MFAQSFTAALASLVLLISANSGVISVSRLTFSMSKFEFISDWFEKVHATRGTPVRTILIFSSIGALEVILAFCTQNAIDTLANRYAFGAALGYTLALISLVRLRFTDPYTPRPYRVPFNVRVQSKHGQVHFPVLGSIGMLSITSVFLIVMITHNVARITGPAWVILCFLYYVWYRRKRKLPVFGTVKRDWEEEQKNVLASAEEFDLLEQYKVALSARDRHKRERERPFGQSPD